MLIARRWKMERLEVSAVVGANQCYLSRSEPRVTVLLGSPGVLAVLYHLPRKTMMQYNPLLTLNTIQM